VLRQRDASLYQRLWRDGLLEEVPLAPSRFGGGAVAYYRKFRERELHASQLAAQLATWSETIFPQEEWKLAVLREQVLTLVRVNKLSAKGQGKTKKIFVIVISIGDRKFGLIVDKLVGEEELVIKALDDHLVATDLVSGASILGDGSVVLILNVNAVVSRLGKVESFGSNAQGATA